MLKRADQIVYVCGNQEEIIKLRKPMKFGQTDFDHDFNRIHFFEPYKIKTINVTFEKTVEISKFADEKLIIHGSESSSTSSGSSFQSTYSRRTNGQSRCLKLPEQIKDLLYHLTVSNEYQLIHSNEYSSNEICVTTKRKDKTIIDRLLMTHLAFTLKNSLKNLNKKKHVNEHCRDSNNLQLYRSYEITDCRSSHLNDSPVYFESSGLSLPRDITESNRLLDSESCEKNQSSSSSCQSSLSSAFE